MLGSIDAYSQHAIIKVIGVGGGGISAVSHMVAANIDGVEFINVDTDSKTLGKSAARTILQLGANLTKGLGCGANPDIGRQTALGDRERIAEVLAGADMVFITAGMGGGTGTGAAPVVARVAKDLGILTVAVVTKPFPFEGKKRQAIADLGIQELTQYVDSIITIPNEKLVSVLGENASLLDAFGKANEILQNAIQAIVELITRPGLINVDFADVRMVMSEMGIAMMGMATASGEHRAREAVIAAVSGPLLEDINISVARGILVNITAGLSMTIGEFEDVFNAVKEHVADDATIVTGTVIDPTMGDEMRITIVVTGLDSDVKSPLVQKSLVKPVYLLVPDSWGGNEIANIVEHLSALYRSIGGDEIVVENISHISPDMHRKAMPGVSRLLRRAG